MHSSQEKKNFARNHLRKQKLAQGYQKDLMLLRRTHPGPEWSIDWYYRDHHGDIKTEDEDRYLLYCFAEDRDDWSRPDLYSVIFLKYNMEQSIRNAQEELDIWEGMYRIQMKDRWALLMIAEGYCHSELTYYELIPYGRGFMVKGYRSDYGYYGPTQYKRFIQRMAHCGDKAIFQHCFVFVTLSVLVISVFNFSSNLKSQRWHWYRSMRKLYAEPQYSKP